MMIPCLCSFNALRILAADCPVAQKNPQTDWFGDWWWTVQDSNL